MPRPAPNRPLNPRRIGVIAMHTFTQLVRMKVFYFLGIFALIAGFIVGFFEGLWASSLGLIFRLCFPLIDLVPQWVQLAGELLSFAAVPFQTLWETAQWFIDLAAGAKPIDEPRKDEKPAVEQPAPEESREQPDAEPDEQLEAEPAVPGTFEAPPAFPAVFA